VEHSLRGDTQALAGKRRLMHHEHEIGRVAQLVDERRDLFVEETIGNMHDAGLCPDDRCRQCQRVPEVQRRGPHDVTNLRAGRRLGLPEAVGNFRGVLGGTGHHELLDACFAQGIDYVVKDRAVRHMLERDRPCQGIAVATGVDVVDDDYSVQCHTQGTASQVPYSRPSPRSSLGGPPGREVQSATPRCWGVMATFAPARPERLWESQEDTRDEALYRRMRFIRRFEERLLELFEDGVLNGTTHACIGQEANCVAVLELLDLEDHVFSNHRCHGHYLARTGDARGLLAEIMGLPEGVCGGIGGSQHLAADGFKSNGVQGGIVPAAAGIAMSYELSRSAAISAVFIGDGTLGEGLVYESLNLVSLWRLPLLIVVEDNGWAQSTPSHLNLAGSMSGRFEAFGVAVREIDSTDVLEIAGVAEDAVSYVREQRAPCALIIHTYRLCHHSKNDDNRPPDEVQARWALDPLLVHGRRLAPGVSARIDAEVAAAFEELVSELTNSELVAELTSS
jgi:TPP-dependent pyruvate/acetoin dehydrogenase alpha subunit